MGACHGGLRGLAVMVAMQKAPCGPCREEVEHQPPCLPAKVIVHSKAGTRFCSVLLDGW